MIVFVHSLVACTYFMWKWRGVNEVKVNASKCVNFMSYGSLKSNSSDT